MKNQLHLFAFFTSTFLCYSSCKLPEKTVTPPLATMPASFNNSADSFPTTLPLNQDQFFTDPVLQNLIDSAIQHNPDLAIALQRVITAGAYLKISKGFTKPSVDGIISTGIDKFGDYTMNGLGNYDMNLSPNINKDQVIPLNMPDFFIGFRSQWEADIWGKLADRKKAAMAQSLASEKGRLWLTTQLVAMVAGLYYDLLALDQELIIIKKNIQLQEDGIEIVKALKAGGRATELAVQQFTAQLLSTKTIMLRVRLQINTTENQLNALSGYYTRKILRGKNILELSLPDTTIKAGIPSDLLTRRPDLQEAELELMAAGANMEIARKAFLPSLNITAYTALNSFNPSFLLTPQSLAYGILGGLVTPILSKNMLKGNAVIASANQQSLFQEYRKKVLAAYSEVATELKKIEANTGIYELKRRETASLTAAVTTAKELYVTGYASYLEVITAQRGVLEAELESIGSKKEIHTGMADLYRQLGGGWKP
jgi:outer membrane protein, multidrug efflux system